MKKFTVTETYEWQELARIEAEYIQPTMIMLFEIADEAGIHRYAVNISKDDEIKRNAGKEIIHA